MAFLTPPFADETIERAIKLGLNCPVELDPHLLWTQKVKGVLRVHTAFGRIAWHARGQRDAGLDIDAEEIQRIIAMPEWRTHFLVEFRSGWPKVSIVTCSKGKSWTGKVQYKNQQGWEQVAYEPGPNGTHVLAAWYKLPSFTMPQAFEIAAPDAFGAWRVMEQIDISDNVL